MGRVKAADEVIWLDDIVDDAQLHDRLKAIQPGAFVDLDVGGFVGRWERIAASRDGLRPSDPLKEAWTRMRADAQVVEIRVVGPNETQLATFEERLYRWDIPQSRIYSD